MTDDDMAVLWTFVGSLVAVKLITSLLILYHFPSWHSVMLVVMLSVIWFVPPLYYLVRNPRARYRLLRARARRHKLLRQEWEVEEPQHRHRVK